MFYRSRSTRKTSPSSPRKVVKRHNATPLEELRTSLDRMEELIDKTRKSWYESQDNTAAKIATPRSRFFGMTRRASKDDEEEAPPPPATTPVTPIPHWRSPEKQAKFIPMDAEEEAEMIELLRRTVELVIVGEKGAAAALSRNEKRRLRQGDPAADDDDEERDDVPEDIDSHIALFEHFFERNALATIVNVVTGEAFKKSFSGFGFGEIEEVESTEEAKEVSDDEENEKNDAEENEQQAGQEENEEDKEQQSGQETEQQKDKGEEANTEEDKIDKPAGTEDGGAEKTLPKTETKPEKPPCTMLPSLAIATQAIQSVSMLIQNVSRATSLYFILSANHINDLIALPVEFYTAAEKHRLVESGASMSQRTFVSSEVAELSTHFITFLKSLALRMNAETLQFYLSYPVEDAVIGNQTITSDIFGGTPEKNLNASFDQPMDELEGNATKKEAVSQKRPVIVEPIQVEFPLYARALEFCAAHHDRFVRVTAMNICLNTLRMATVSPGTDPEGHPSPDKDFGSSPDGVLHNAKPLPLRERLAIAQHVCSPTRVEELISPVFTKLAQLWGVLEEQFRDADIAAKRSPVNSFDDLDAPKKSRNAKVEKAKEEARSAKMADSIGNAGANLQDELLLLEDLLKVGLSSLNEQIIEMMLATFVYPLLLQPLLQYVQLLPSTRLEDPTHLASGGMPRPERLMEKSFSEDMSYVSAPAKTALFSLASVFYLISNRPLLRLLLTSLLHPLSPDPSGEKVIRAFPDIAHAGPDGHITGVRVDNTSQSIAEDEKVTYSFGQEIGEIASRDSSGNDQVCVFVLSPALVEVLEGSAGDVTLMAKTRPNPYRQAILQCLVGDPSMIQIRHLSTLLVDSFVVKFDAKFVGELMFGSGMKTFGDEIPMDERNLDTQIAHTSNDRDIGGGGNIQSRRSVSSSVRRGSSGTDYLTEAVTALSFGIVNLSLGSDGGSKIEFDDIAAHAMLCAVSESSRALQTAAKLLDRQKRQCASLLAGSASKMAEDPEEDDEVLRGMAIDMVMHDAVRTGELSVVEELVYLQKEKNDLPFKPEEHLLSVALESDYEDLTERTCSSMKSPQREEELDADEIVDATANSALALLRLDALSNLMAELAATNGNAFRKRRLAGLGISSDGTIVDTSGYYGKKIHRSVFAPLSKEFRAAVFDEENLSSGEKAPPASGSVVGLVGRTAFPCVCEVPAASAHLFAHGTASVISEGVKWQSLYLVFLGRFMILAEPEKGGSGGDGRVITACKLAQVQVEKDAAPPMDDGGSSARRLKIGFDGYDKNLPGMFLFDEEPEDTLFGPFVRTHKIHSSLDIWFEDENSSAQAFKALSSKISKAKAKRGNRLRERLSPEA